MAIKDAVARAIAESHGYEYERDNHVFNAHADHVLAALGLDDFDAAVERAAYPIYVGCTLKPWTSPATPEHKAPTALTQEQATNLARKALELALTATDAKGSSDA